MNKTSKRALTSTGKPTRWLLTMLAIWLGLVTPMLLIARPAHAHGGLPVDVFDPQEIGWASVRTMTSAQFSTDFAKRKKTQMVIDLEIDEIDGNQRVSAVWQTNITNRDWASLRNLTSAEFAQEWQQRKDQGYRLIDQEIYLLGGQWRYAGVWTKNVERLNWASYRNVTSADFSAKFQQYRDNYLPIDFEGYSVGSSIHYAAAWVENTDNLKWSLVRDLSASQYATLFQQYRNNYRVLDVESYHHDGKQYYAAIWLENPDGRYWKTLRDMTSKQFGDTWQALLDEGYRLVDFEIYDTGNGWSYAGSWRQNGDRLNWEHREAVTTLLEDQMDEFDIPGMSVVIADDGEIVYQRGFGYADIDDQKRATSQTIYRLASVSKAVGGTLAFRLMEEGTFGDIEETPTRDYLPTLPARHNPTVGQLVSHRGGFGHYGTHGSWNEQFDTALEAAQQFWNDAPIYTPGQGYAYSTHTWTIAGAAMEGATGLPITEIVENTITDPYNLPTLRVEDRSQPNSKRATLYNTNNTEATPDNLSWKVLGGGLESSAYDLTRFGMKLVDGSILGPDARQTMWTPPDNRSDFSYGWNTGTESGPNGSTQVVARIGAQTGARSYIRMYPTEGIVITILSNRQSGGHSPVQMGRDIGALMLASQPVISSEGTEPERSTDSGITRELIQPVELVEPIESSELVQPVDSTSRNDIDRDSLDQIQPSKDAAIP